MKFIKSEKGSITIYVIITMLFFTVFIMRIYLINSRSFVSQLKENSEVKALYENGGAAQVFTSHFATSDEEIPIYTREQLLSIASNENIYISQEKKIYTFSEEKKYVIKNNITDLTTQDLNTLSAKLVYVKNYDEYMLSGNYLLKVTE